MASSFLGLLSRHVVAVYFVTTEQDIMLTIGFYDVIIMRQKKSHDVHPRSDFTKLTKEF